MAPHDGNLNRITPEPPAPPAWSAQEQPREARAQTHRIDPLDHPPSPDLVARWGVRRALSSACLPWRVIGGQTIILAATRPDFDAHKAALEQCFGTVRLAIADQARCHRAIQRIADPRLVRTAEARVGADLSCRTLNPLRTRIWFLAILALLTLWAVWDVTSLILVTCGCATFCAISGSLYKFVAALAHFKAPTAQEPPPLPQGTLLPVITIFVPVFREENIASHLLERLKRLNYPRDRLEIMIVTERSDRVTQLAMAKTDLPAWMRVITVPKGGCQTKPRAMNYALDFARGEIIGIYDAEDAPEPDQLLHVARRFAVAPPQTACLQGILDFYNTESNWLSRCFTMEYAAWFRITMPGLERLGFILPLGGTTLFLRRAVLEDLGAWDAHNVTEDADLGVRLARAGYRTEMIRAATYEEACARPRAWVKQRSRWLKGYAVTYWVAMRQPRRLLREIGWRRCLGLQFQFAATLGTFLLVPALWSYWLAMFGMPHPMMQAIGPIGVWGLTTVFFLAELLTITLAAAGAQASGRRWLMRWAPTMHFYYPLAALACYKAFWELAKAPFYWDKTTHGVFAPTGTHRRTNT